MSVKLTPTQALEYAIKIIFAHSTDGDARVCVLVLKQTLDNILADPEEYAKLRRFKSTKSPFAEQVTCRKGGIEFLQACGFQHTDTKYLNLPNEVMDLAHLTKARDLLRLAAADGYKPGMANAGAVPNPLAPPRPVTNGLVNGSSSFWTYNRMAMLEKDFFDFANNRLRPTGSVTQKEIVETFRYCFYAKYRFYGKEGDQMYTVTWRETEELLWKWNAEFARATYKDGTYTGIHMTTLLPPPPEHVVASPGLKIAKKTIANAKKYKNAQVMAPVKEEASMASSSNRNKAAAPPPPPQPRPVTVKKASSKKLGTAKKKAAAPSALEQAMFANVDALVGGGKPSSKPRKAAVQQI